MCNHKKAQNALSLLVFVSNYLIPIFIMVLYIDPQQVRVWDIEANVCLTMTTFTQTIISLAFHPKGHFIAVACGMHIELWDWNNRDESGITPTARAAKPYNAEEDGSAENYFDGEVEEYPPHWRSITHTRNIRAVLFHPSGDYIFAVAPEAPKQSNDELAHCR